jgi:cellulose synthase/poly-beta-1,6-N-acetylglucosamine synthase-like glycosyltransferase
VDFRPHSGILASLQNLEFLSLMASGAGAAGIRKPIYCNSANLMFEKDAYFAIKDPFKKNAVSGDDTFLLHQIKKMHPHKILVLKCRDAIVETETVAKLNEFINQRIRWISKGRYYKDLQIIGSATVVVASNLTILGWMAASFICARAIFLLPLIFKMIADWLFMIPVLSFFHKKKLHFLVPVLSVIYPFYVVIFALAGLYGRFTWKGRHF